MPSLNHLYKRASFTSPSISSSSPKHHIISNKMEKESLHNKFKLLKLSNFFTSACQNQNISQVIDHNKNPNFLQTPLLNKIQDDEEQKHPFCNFVNKPEPEKINSSSSSLTMCKAKCRQTYNIATTTGNPFPRQKITGKHSMFSPSGDFSGWKCPPGSPVSPLFQKQGYTENKKKNNPINKEKVTHFRKNGFKPNPFSFSSSSENGDNGDWFSSDDEREDYEKQTMFSLKSVSFSSKSVSLSSDSDNQTRTQTQARTWTRSQPRRQKTGSMVKEVGVVSLEGKVKDTLAIVKKSSDDPYNDFRKIQGQGQTQTQTQTRPRRRKAGSRAKKMGAMPLEGNVKGTVAIGKSSSDPYNDLRNIQGPTQTQTRITRPRRRSRVKEVGVVPLEVRAKDTFAIVKSSSDPYNDFRKSMVEMIMEKQIFGAKELEQLLECFLFLNSFHHHKVIAEVFSEICDALFCHCS